MSKKSRRRNRKLLMMAALAGGAALAGRRKKASIADMDDAGIGVRHSALTDTAPVVKKAVVANAGNAAGASPHIFDTRFSKPAQETISKGVRSRNLAANAAKNAAMNYQRSQTFDAKPRFGALSNVRVNQPGSSIIRQYKKGGRVKKTKVTGIAKRGFGRALMKGKK